MQNLQNTKTNQVTMCDVTVDEVELFIYHIIKSEMKKWPQKLHLHSNDVGRTYYSPLISIDIIKTGGIDKCLRTLYELNYIDMFELPEKVGKIKVQTTRYFVMDKLIKAIQKVIEEPGWHVYSIVENLNDEVFLVDNTLLFTINLEGKNAVIYRKKMDYCMDILKKRGKKAGREYVYYDEFKQERSGSNIKFVITPYFLEEINFDIMYELYEILNKD